MPSKTPPTAAQEHSYPLADTGLFLVEAVPGVTKAVDTPTATDHIVVIDCSGSMGNDLPHIRRQLKAKLPPLLRNDPASGGAGDTISLVWFSGKGECGTLLEGATVDSLKDLQTVNATIDRWLKTVGMTGFKDPLVEVAALVKRLGGKRPASLFFLTDGCENQWPRADVLAALAKVNVAAATFVEYGYYADRQLLSQMAEKAGGALIFAETFDKYEPALANALARRPSTKRVEVALSGDAVGGFAFALAPRDKKSPDGWITKGEAGDILTFDASAGKVHVPEDTDAVYYLSPKATSHAMGQANPAIPGALYAALSLYATRMKSDVVYAILKSLGDVAFIDQFANCFGKQKYSEFMELTRAAAFDVGHRFTKGVDFTRIPPDDAFTVLDLLRTLTADEDNRILLDHDDFRYSKISRARVDADENFSAAEQEELDGLVAKLAAGKLKPATIKEIGARIEVLTAAKRTALKFVADPAPDGYSLEKLTYNEDRPNISVMVVKQGTVDLTERLTTAEAHAALPGSMPVKFPTHIFRNYALVKDGMVNVERLPVRLSSATQQALLAANGGRGCPGLVQQLSDRRGTGDVLLNLKALPIVNRKMVKTASAKALFDLEWALVKSRCAQKVFGHYEKLVRSELAKTGGGGVRSKGWAELYGAEATTWLSAQGLSEYNGFSPKVVQAEAKDVYVGKELVVKLAGFASIPSVKDILERMEKAKAKKKDLEGITALMAPMVETSERHLDHPHKYDAMSLAYFEQHHKLAVQDTRRLIAAATDLKFAVVVGQTWFSEWKSLDENTLDLDLGLSEKVLGTVTMREIEIKI